MGVDSQCKEYPILRFLLLLTTWKNFFTNVKSLVSEANASTQAVDQLKSLSVDDSASDLASTLQKAQADLEAALTDSFDTPKAMRVIYELIRDTNIYLNAHSSSPNLHQVEKVARWITKIVGIFGLDANAKPPYDGLGWAASVTNGITNPKEAAKPYASAYEKIVTDIKKLDISSENLTALLSADPATEFESVTSTGAADIESLALPYLRPISRLRDELRKLVPSQTPETKKQILVLSDRIRDIDLTNLGVYLDDRPNDLPSLIKFVPASELIAAREEKLAKEKEKAAAKEAARLQREKLEEEKRAKAKVSPFDMFRSDEKYGEWTAEGLPSKMKDGSEVPKAQGKKLRKEWERQKKLWEEFGGGK